MRTMVMLYILIGVFFVPVVFNMVAYAVYHKYKDITEARKIHEEFQ